MYQLWSRLVDVVESVEGSPKSNRFGTHLIRVRKSYYLTLNFRSDSTTESKSVFSVLLSPFYSKEGLSIHGERGYFGSTKIPVLSP